MILSISCPFGFDHICSINSTLFNTQHQTADYMINRRFTNLMMKFVDLSRKWRSYWHCAIAIKLSCSGSVQSIIPCKNVLNKIYSMLFYHQCSWKNFRLNELNGHKFWQIIFDFLLEIFQKSLKVFNYKTVVESVLSVNVCSLTWYYF